MQLEQDLPPHPQLAQSPLVVVVSAQRQDAACQCWSAACHNQKTENPPTSWSESRELLGHARGSTAFFAVGGKAFQSCLQYGARVFHLTGRSQRFYWACLSGARDPGFLCRARGCTREKPFQTHERSLCWFPAIR